MQTVKMRERAAGGMDERYVAELGAASLIVNMRMDKEGGAWVHDRGWEPYNPTPGYTVVVTEDFNPLYSLAVWSRQSGAELYCLYEQGGSLLYEHGLSSGTSTTAPARQVLATGRQRPLPSEPGTQYFNHGSDLIIMGADTLLRFRGDKLVAPFGFTTAPAPPQVFAPDPTYYATVATRNESGTTAAKLMAPRGLGDAQAATDGSEVNRYTYRVAFETETGSISPLSAAASAAWSFDAAAEQGRYGVLLRSIPRGPAGTVARRLYRTKNLKSLDAQGEAQYFFLARIPENSSTDFMDIAPDSVLVSPAPSLTDSISIPGTLRFGASWDGRVWMAGGADYEQRILYSEEGAPEQFGAFNFYNLGNTNAGDITGLIPFYGVLLVFREFGIDAIVPDQAGILYRVSVISRDVGTVATNTITLVPGVGVMFLTGDGVRIVSGSPSSMVVSAPNTRVAREARRINEAALASACAAWSPLEREWWCHYPADGQSSPNRGLVYHIDAQAWSVRGSDSQVPGAFQFNAMASLPSGHFLLAPETTRVVSTPSISIIYNRGLQVWSACGVQGERFTATNIDANLWSISSVENNAATNGQWCSVWEDFGDDSVYKSVRYVLVDVLAVGNAPILLEYAVDYLEQYSSAGTQSPAVSDRYKGSNQAALFGAGQVGDKVARIGSSLYSGITVTRLRWDVGASSTLWFKWRLSSSARFHVVRYQIGYVPRSRTVIHQG